MRTTLIFLIIIPVSVSLWAQETCTLLNSGAISSLGDSDWSCTTVNNPSEIPDDGLGSVVIPNTISLDIDKIPETIWSTSLTVQSGGTLTLSKRLNLTGAATCTYTLTVDSGGSLIVPTGPAGLTRLYICGNYVIGVNGSPAYTASPPETISGPQVIDDVGGTLPIELIYFDGYSEKSTIKLRWATASEDNFHFFVLEKSKNGKDFHALGEIQSLGGFEQFQEYFYTDEAPFPDLNYYRLKAIDHDGSYEYHPIIGIKFEGELTQKILIYPNPLSGNQFTVRPNFEFNSASIRFQDVVGKNTVTWNQIYPSQSFILPKNINPGLYIVEFISIEGTHKQKIIIK